MRKIKENANTLGPVNVRQLLKNLMMFDQRQFNQRQSLLHDLGGKMEVDFPIIW